MFWDILCYIIILVIFFFSIFALIRFFIVVLNINFNKIYLTKKFSIIKLLGDNNFDVAELLQLTNKLSALEQEFEDQLESYNTQSLELEQINITYTALMNANTILKNEIEVAKKKLNTVKKIEKETEEKERAQKSFIIYQMLLFKQYMFFILDEEIKKYKKALESFRLYQMLLFKQYMFFILDEEIKKYKSNKELDLYQMLLFKQYAFFILDEEIKKYKESKS